MSAPRGAVAKSPRNAGACLRGDAAREARLELSLSQEALAHAAGVTTRTVQRAEAGKSLSMDSVQRLSATLGLPLVALLRPGPGWVRDRLMTQGLLPPARPEPWAERQADEQAVAAAVTAEAGGRCVVTGLSGIGKTSLASRVADSLRAQFPDGIVWLGSAAWSGHAGQLAVAEALRFRDRLPRPELAGSTVFDVAFVHRFFELPRVLVLDDVTDVEQVRRFFHPRARLLVTTALRFVADELHWAKVELGPLTLEDTVRLLNAHVGERSVTDAEGTRTLAALVAGSPRSAQIAGRVLRRERYVAPGEYAARLREDLARAASRPRAPDETFFAADAQLQERLSSETWRVFEAISVFEEVGFTSDWAAVAADLPTVEARRHLGELVDAYLINRTAGPEPRFHLDGSASRAARWSAGEDVSEAWDRVLIKARSRVREIAAMVPCEAVATLRPDRDLWRHILAHAVTTCWPGEAPGFVADPAQLPAWHGEADATARALPRLLTLLGGPLTFATSGATREWFAPVIAVAHALGDARSEGQLAFHLARVSFGLWDFRAAERWSAHAHQLLERHDPDESALARLFQATANFVLTGLPGHVPDVEAVLEVARRPGVSHRTLALVTMAAACGLGTSSARGHLRRSEALYAEVAADPPPAELAPLVGPVATINLAMLRRVLGRPIPDTTLSALDTVLAATPHDGLDRWRHDAIRSFLGFQPARTEPPSDTELRSILLGVPQEETLHRCQSLTDLVVMMPTCYAALARGRDRFASSLLGVGAPWSGRETEIEVGNMMLLFPLAAMVPLIDGEGLRLARRWAAATLAEDHPLIGGLATLAAIARPQERFAGGAIPSPASAPPME